MSEYVINAPRSGTLIKIVVFTILCLLASVISVFIFDGVPTNGQQVTIAILVFIFSTLSLPLPWIMLLIESTLIFSNDNIKVTTWASYLLKTNCITSYPLQDIKVGYAAEFLSCFFNLKKTNSNKNDLIIFNFLSKKDLITKLSDGHLNIKITSQGWLQ